MDVVGPSSTDRSFELERAQSESQSKSFTLEIYGVPILQKMNALQPKMDHSKLITLCWIHLCPGLCRLRTWLWSRNNIQSGNVMCWLA